MKRGYYLAMGVFLLIDIIIFSLYPLFNNAEPRLFGLTEFYWVQIILLIITSLIYFTISYAFRGENA